MHFADLTDKHSIDLVVRQDLLEAPDRPYVFHLGAQAHVHESWHRPYETFMANTVGGEHRDPTVHPAEVLHKPADPPGRDQRRRRRVLRHDQQGSHGRPIRRC